MSLPNRRLAVHLLRQLLWTGVAAAALFAARSGHAADAASDWMPLRPGETRVYAVHRDHSYIPENASIDRTFHVGTATRKTRAAGEIAPGAVAFEERMHLEPVQYGTKEDHFESRVYAADGGRVLLHASGAIASGGEAPPARYEPPLVLLPGATAGTTWTVGTVRDGESSVRMRGEVVGVRSAEGKPPCESCLEVRYTGTISGAIPIYQGSAKILSGEYRRTIWLERGVGIVRDDTQVDTEIELPDGKKAKTSHKQTLRLEANQPAP